MPEEQSSKIKAHLLSNYILDLVFFKSFSLCPQKLDLAKFQTQKDRENVKWSAIEYKKVKAI